MCNRRFVEYVRLMQYRRYDSQGCSADCIGSVGVGSSIQVSYTCI
jgi:hypothetical protein